MGKTAEAMKERRKSLFARLQSGGENGMNIVEVGIGSGPNLKCFPPKARVTGIDPSRMFCVL